MIFHCCFQTSTQSLTALEVTAMAELTLKEMETVQRAIGIVEGVSFGVSDEVASALVVAVEMLDSVFGGDGK
jgi:hypothetical protein